MKRFMPSEHLKQVERYFNLPLAKSHAKSIESEAASQQFNPIFKGSRHRRKHNDSISESKLIKEKLPSSSLATIAGKSNVLISRNNHNILESIDLTTTDNAVLKKLMNNNNGDLSSNTGGFDDDNEAEELGGDSDSETITGDESLFEEDSEADSEYIIERSRNQINDKRVARMINQ